MAAAGMPLPRHWPSITATSRAGAKSRRNGPGTEHHVGQADFGLELQLTSRTHARNQGAADTAAQRPPAVGHRAAHLGNVNVHLRPRLPVQSTPTSPRPAVRHSASVSISRLTISPTLTSPHV